MFTLSIYKIPNGRFRWKLIRSKVCVARSDNHYISRSAARTAFNSIFKGLQKAEIVPIET